MTEPEISQDEKSVQQWCKAIISFRAAEIKARVDAVYLNSLRTPGSDSFLPDTEGALKEQKMALQTELETLHQEIASITEMVVEHEIRQPMTDMQERREREKTQARAAWLNYVSIGASKLTLVVNGV